MEEGQHEPDQAPGRRCQAVSDPGVVLSRVRLCIAMAICSIAGTGDLPAKLQGNIPSDRLAGDTYTSPDGGFEVKLPPLAMPGAKAEERQVDARQMGVFFADDFGNVYYVLRTDNASLNYDLEKIAAEYTVNDVLREKTIVSTGRGSELRLSGILPEGSPIVAEIKVKRKTTHKKLNLHQAMSLFLVEGYIYEVAAGVTATHQESDEEMFTRAKQRLDAFLVGLRIKASVPL